MIESNFLKPLSEEQEATISGGAFVDGFSTSTSGGGTSSVSFSATGDSVSGSFSTFSSGGGSSASGDGFFNVNDRTTNIGANGNSTPGGSSLNTVFANGPTRTFGVVSNSFDGNLFESLILV